MTLVRRERTEAASGDSVDSRLTRPAGRQTFNAEAAVLSSEPAFQSVFDLSILLVAMFASLHFLMDSSRIQFARGVDRSVDAPRMSACATP